MEESGGDMKTKRENGERKNFLKPPMRKLSRANVTEMMMLPRRRRERERGRRAALYRMLMSLLRQPSCATTTNNRSSSNSGNVVVGSPRATTREVSAVQDNGNGNAFDFNGSRYEEDKSAEKVMTSSPVSQLGGDQRHHKVQNKASVNLDDIKRMTTSMVNSKGNSLIKLTGAKKRKPKFVRRIVRVEEDEEEDDDKHEESCEEVDEEEIEEDFKVGIHQAGLTSVSRILEEGKGSDDAPMTLTADDVFKKPAQLELLGEMGRLGVRKIWCDREINNKGREIISMCGDMACSDNRRLSNTEGGQELKMPRRKVYPDVQNEAFDLSFKKTPPNISTEAFSDGDGSFVTPEVLLEERTGAVTIWEDSRPREALGDFVYAAAVASHGGWRTTENVDDDDYEEDTQDLEYERSCEVQELLAQQGAVSYRGRIPRDENQYNDGSIASEAEAMYNHRSVVTSSGDVVGLDGFNAEFRQEKNAAEALSTSWVFAESKTAMLYTNSNTCGQIQPQFQMDTRHELPPQVPQKRPRGRPRQTPNVHHLGGPSSEVSTTVSQIPKRGRPRGTGAGNKLSGAFCGSKSCMEREEEAKRIRNEKRMAAKALKELEKSKRAHETLVEDEEFMGKSKKPKQIRYRTERPFICPHCPGSFTLRSNMERHGKQQHPNLWMPSPSVRHQRRKNEPQKTDYGVYWDENTTQY